MNLQIHPLGREEIPIFNREDNRAFSVHDQYFADGHVPGATEEEREEYNLEKIIGNGKYTVLGLYDDGTFVGGAIVEDMGNQVSDIGIFFLIVEYQSKGIGKTALDLVESCFPDTRTFRLITPSQVVRNVVFYVNKCGYRIVEVVDFDRGTNTADYVFEKPNPHFRGSVLPSVATR